MTTPLSPATAFKLLTLAKKHPERVNADGLVDIIKRTPEYSYKYARDIIKGRWEDGEVTIATSAMYAHLYAEFVLKARFHAGEDAIATDAKYATAYAVFVIKDRLPQAEGVIAASGDTWLMFDYARNAIKGRWPEVEHIIATSPSDAYAYVHVILNDTPWPLAEQAIARDAKSACNYAINVLKARWPLAEEALKEYEYFWKIYCKHFDIV